MIKEVLLPVKPRRQYRDYLCGAAAIQMALFYFRRRLLSQDAIAKLSGASIAQLRKRGIANKEMIVTLRRLKMKYRFMSDANRLDIIRSLDRGYLVIVNHLDANFDGHYSIVCGYLIRSGALFIHLIDPDIGKLSRVRFSEFTKRWRSGFERHRHWLVQVWPD